MDTEIIKAFFTAVNDFDSCLPASYSGVDFTPPDKGLWVEVKAFPNEPENISWDADGQQVYLGFMQVSIYFRSGAGIIDASEKADKIIEYFAKGKDLGPVKVERRPFTGPVIADDDYLFIPVTIPYRGIA
jgi:hypothetical protein